MKVSGRVTNSFYCFLNQKHFDTSRFYELSSLEMSFIKDPYTWMDASAVENFLKKISEEFNPHFVEEDLIQSVGHSALELKAWGDLDSALKLNPIFNIYEKIEDIMQWFVVPFSIKNFQNINNQITFEANLSTKEYPYLISYLKSVLEVLPRFNAEDSTSVLWENNQVQVSYTPYGQLSFFTEKDPKLSPDLLRKIKNSVLSLEKEYLKQRRVLAEKSQAIQSFQDQKDQAFEIFDEMEKTIQSMKGKKDKTFNNQVTRLYQCMSQMRDMFHGQD